MLLREQLKKIVDGENARFGRAFSLSVQSLFVVSLVSFSMEIVPDLGGALVEHDLTTEAAA